MLVGRPTRWTDGLAKAAGSRWMQAASNLGHWKSTVDMMMIRNKITFHTSLSLRLTAPLHIATLRS